MNAPASLPDSIHTDIGIYLAPGEKILKALTPFAAGAAGQVWLILTSQSVVFHTREAGKEPLVALLPRKDIKEIEYFQKQSGVQLTFIPAGNSQKVSRLNFGPEKQEELEDFCEELADLINFKKETASGIRIYSPPSSATPAAATSKQQTATPAAATAQTGQTRQAPAAVEPELRHAASSIRHADKPEISAMPKTDASPTQAVSDSDKPAEPRLTRQSPAPAEVKIVKPSAGKSSGQQVNASNATDGNNEFRASYVIIATLVSLLVAFIWYKFFMIVSGWKEPRNR